MTGCHRRLMSEPERKIRSGVDRDHVRQTDRNFAVDNSGVQRPIFAAYPCDFMAPQWQMHVLWARLYVSTLSQRLRAAPKPYDPRSPTAQVLSACFVHRLVLDRPALFSQIQLLANFTSSRRKQHQSLWLPELASHLGFLRRSF